MPAEITMPQLSDTMTEGTVVKWHKKEGDKVKAGEEIADVETDKATMPMEAFDSGTLAYIAAPEGTQVKVGDRIAVIATAGEDPAKIKQQFASESPKSAGAPKASAAPAPSAAPPKRSAGPLRPTSQAAAAPATAPVAAAHRAHSAGGPPRPHYDYDIIVIGGGPAGYAAAIRAGQLKRRTLCIERDQLGGICLNWGCIPTKALLENGALIRRLREEPQKWGVSFENLKIDFPAIIGRSRGIADKLSRGIAHLLGKYEVKHEVGSGQLLSPHRVRLTGKDNKSREITGGDIILATGARARALPGIEFDGTKIISSKEAMSLPRQPRRLAVIGAGAIGCEFADFYNALGTEVQIVELLEHVLPLEDTDVSVLLERLFTRRGIRVHTKSKTERVEKTADGVRLHCSSAAKGEFTIDADVVLLAVGVTGNVENLGSAEAKLELVKNHVKVDSHYATNVANVYAVGDVIGPPWLAHVAHHEAVLCVEHICGVSDHTIDYKQIPACTYTHPQVASMGLSEAKARQSGRAIKIGKFPFSASGRALAAGESDGFVKLIFDAQYGELLGVHMIGENVTELLGELVLARKLEATEVEIIEAMHPHPTISEAVMEAAGVADGRAIHL